MKQLLEQYAAAVIAGILALLLLFMIRQNIYGQGIACDYSEEEATKILFDSEVTAFVDMHMGDAEATAWGCDLTYDYVKINADYRS